MNSKPFQIATITQRQRFCVVKINVTLQLTLNVINKYIYIIRSVINFKTTTSFQQEYESFNILYKERVGL